MGEREREVVLVTEKEGPTLVVTVHVVGLCPLTIERIFNS